MASKPQPKRHAPEPEPSLPVAEDIERETLGHILVTGKVRDSLPATHFQPAQHQRIWRAIAALRERSEPIDRLTVAEELKTQRSLSSVGGLSYLVSLETGMFPELNLNRHIDILKEKALLRRLINHANG